MELTAITVLLGVGLALLLFMFFVWGFLAKFEAPKFEQLSREQWARIDKVYQEQVAEVRKLHAVRMKDLN